MSHLDATSTRGRILALLCGADQTVGELADAIGVSRNAIRLQLQDLEGDGLVAYDLLRRGVGKPAHLYRLTPTGEWLLSRAYLPLLDGLLRVLASRLTEEELLTLLREVGHHLALRQPKPQGRASDRVDAAVALLEALGGAVELETAEDGAFLCGRCCPVAALTPDHPQICAAVEALLEAFTGLPVREYCDRSGRPSCRFEISSVEAEGGR